MLSSFRAAFGTHLDLTGRTQRITAVSGKLNPSPSRVVRNLAVIVSAATQTLYVTTNDGTAVRPYKTTLHVVAAGHTECIIRGMADDRHDCAISTI